VGASIFFKTGRIRNFLEIVGTDPNTLVVGVIISANA